MMGLVFSEKKQQSMRGRGMMTVPRDASTVLSLPIALGHIRNGRLPDEDLVCLYQRVTKVKETRSSTYNEVGLNVQMRVW